LARSNPDHSNDPYCDHRRTGWRSCPLDGTRFRGTIPDVTPTQVNVSRWKRAERTKYKSCLQFKWDNPTLAAKSSARLPDRFDPLERTRELPYLLDPFGACFLCIVTIRYMSGFADTLARNIARSTVFVSNGQSLPIKVLSVSPSHLATYLLRNVGTTRPR
jgi:hypothetical protein